MENNSAIIRSIVETISQSLTSYDEITVLGHDVVIETSTEVVNQKEETTALMLNLSVDKKVIRSFIVEVYPCTIGVQEDLFDGE